MTKQEWNKRNYQENKEKFSAYNREYANSHKDDIRQRRQKWYQENKEQVSHQHREYHRANRGKRYGLGRGEYDRMFTAQNGVCKICGNPESKRNQFGPLPLSIDHDHDTGKVRGLLCLNCNNGLGHFKEEIARLKNAVNYLENFGKN